MRMAGSSCSPTSSPRPSRWMPLKSAARTQTSLCRWLKREPENNRRPLFVGTHRLHRPAMGLDDVLDDRETETGPALAARARFVGTIKTLEDMRQIGRWNADAGV